MSTKAQEGEVASPKGSIWRRDASILAGSLVLCTTILVVCLSEGPNTFEFVAIWGCFGLALILRRVVKIWEQEPQEKLEARIRSYPRSQALVISVGRVSAYLLLWACFLGMLLGLGSILFNRFS